MMKLDKMINIFFLVQIYPQHIEMNSMELTSIKLSVNWQW